MDKKPKKDPSSAAESLLSKEKNYEDLFNSLNDAATLFEMRSNGMPGRYLEVNDTLCQWLGYTREELLKLSPLDISEKVDETVNSEVAGTFAEKGKSVIERTLIAKDGRKIPVEVNFHLITYKRKKAVLSISRDVSERNTAEAALRQSEEKFSKAFHAGLLPMTISSLVSGKFIDINPEFVRFSGWTRQEVLGRTAMEIGLYAHPDDRQAIFETLKKEGRVRNLELDLLTKAGTPMTFLWSAEIITLGGEQCLLTTSHDITAQKKAEDALRESEEKFFKIFHTNPLPMSISSLPDGKYVDVNEEFERVSGWSVQEAKGRTTAELNMWIHPGDFSMLVEQVAKKNSLRGVELELRSRTGDIFTFLWSAEVMALGGRRCIITSAYDITDRKKMEDALRESEEKFRTVIEQNSDGIVLVDEQGKIIEWNRELERISGVSRAEAIGKDYWELQFQSTTKERRTPEAYARMKSLLRSGLNDFSKLRTDIDAALSRPDGSIVNIHQSVFPVKTKSGYLLGSVIRDITEKKNAEEALRGSEQRFKALIENAFEGITVIDKEYKVKYESPGLDRILGYSIKERYGTGAFDYIHPDDVPQVQEAFGRAMAHPEETIPMVLRIKRKDGTWRWIECIGKNLFNDAAINGIVVNYRDITERKQAEDAQQKLEQQIQQVEKLESLGILAGGIAHDFNNLLTGIFGYIDVARLYNASGASDKVTMNLSKALDVFNRARALTQQLLTFSKGGTPVKKMLSLSPLLTSTANFVLSGSNVSARFSFSDGLWPCEVDENQLGQVIDNIIINARQAMPTGGSIVVTAENIPEGQLVPAPLVPGNYVRISIRDFGTGISKEHLPHIFDPFFTTKQEGSGLGLATAYSIIRKHEGVIEVESELGIGSTFHLYLPALPSAATELLSTGIKKHRGQGTILVMDDEEFVRDVAMELLKTMGYSVEFAKHGEEAVEKYKKAFSSPAPYVLAILDLTIPGGMGGLDAVKELLKINPSLLAIAASGYSQDPVMTDPQAFGFKDKIRKPFTKEELGEVLERVTKEA